MANSILQSSHSPTPNTAKGDGDAPDKPSHVKPGFGWPPAPQNCVLGRSTPLPRDVLPVARVKQTTRKKKSKKSKKGEKKEEKKRQERERERRAGAERHLARIAGSPAQLSPHTASLGWPDLSILH